jgi:3-hydroxyacyl-CoA dehydrogenase/3-hydroxy-2-methylbutyryl-CoA dehydrogenase
MVKLSGSHVIVTGGASGLGEAVVRRCVTDGAKVSIFDISAELGNKIVEELGKENVAFFKVNIIDEKSVQESLEGGIKAFGAIRAVIQCAGIAAPCRVISSRGVVHTLKSFEHVVNVNLIGTFNVLRLATALMAKSEPLEDGERGCFVHVASVAAFEGQIGQVS